MSSIMSHYIKEEDFEKEERKNAVHNFLSAFQDLPDAFDGRIISLKMETVGDKYCYERCFEMVVEIDALGHTVTVRFYENDIGEYKIITN